MDIIAFRPSKQVQAIMFIIETCKLLIHNTEWLNKSTRWRGGENQRVLSPKEETLIRV
jgi:hypothetical protein